MYIITKNNNKFLSLKINDLNEIEEYDINLDELDDKQIYFGIDDIKSTNYINLIELSEMSLKDLYKYLNPSKKFMEQKKNKSRRLKFIYNLLYKMIELDKFNINEIIKKDKIPENIESSDSISTTETEKVDDEEISDLTDSEDSTNKNVSTQISVKEFKDYIIMGKLSFITYSTVVFLSGMTFNFYFPNFKFNFIK